MAPTVSATAPTLETIKVAVVEDDSDVCHGLAMLIDSAPGFTCVATCPSAEEALVGLPERQPDVVLMDIGLPGMSGIEVIRRLTFAGLCLPVIFITANDSDTMRRAALDAGCVAYLTKPFSATSLLDVIERTPAGRG